ncbi:MAG: CBS domain-containing protein [Syntrophobacteraceae bacterium]|nr:CBS domain-containing protein [Syntrophobacteraceae bacterium]NTV43029.1 CBS domain-containing protein [Syntrophobacteraceae bacterium]
MLKAKDIMTKDLITLSPDTEISEAAGILLERRINGAPVVDADGRLRGILCQSDLIAQQKRFPVPSVFTLLDSFIPLSSQKSLEREMKKIVATRVADAMTENPVSVDLETSLEVIATLMVERKFHTLPVVDGGRVVGIIGKEDVLRTILPISGKD